jgi:hypothetical protein
MLCEEGSKIISHEIVVGKDSSTLSQNEGSSSFNCELNADKSCSMADAATGLDITSKFASILRSFR